MVACWIAHQTVNKGDTYEHGTNIGKMATDYVKSQQADIIKTSEQEWFVVDYWQLCELRVRVKGVKSATNLHKAKQRAQEIAELKASFVNESTDTTDPIINKLQCD